MQLSVAIIFYNKPEQTIEALESVRDVWFGGIGKVYLLNNGSHADATKMIEQYLDAQNANAREGIVYIKLPVNAGASVGRNTIIRQITDGWIVFMDNDITITTPNWFAVLQEAIKNNPEALAFAPKLFNKHEGTILPWYNILPEGNIIKIRVAMDNYSNIVRGGGIIAHRRFFDLVGLYDERFVACLEDNELSIRALRSGRAFKVYNLPTIEYCHEHRKSTHEYDNTYLQTRYGEETLRFSQKLIKELYGLEHDHDPKNWCDKQIATMQADAVEPTSEPTPARSYNRVLLYAIEQYRIGGIETFNINFCKRMSKYYDVTFLCEKGDYGRLHEMAKYCKVVINRGQKLETDVCVYTVAWGKPPTSTIKAGKYIQMIHGDYEWLKKVLGFEYKALPMVSEHVCVSQHVASQFKKMTGLDSHVIYNVLDPATKAQKVLKLITITRIAREKGFERMLTFINMLEQAGIPYLFYIYGDGKEAEYTQRIKNLFAGKQHVLFMGVHEKPTNYVASCDYYVSFSDSEGFSYSTYEALQVGTPCLITDYPSGKEQVTDGVNGYIFGMDANDKAKLTGVDVLKVYNNIPNKFTFTEKATDKDWIKLLGKVAPKGTVTTNGIENYSLKQVTVISQFDDLEANRQKRLIGDIIEVTPERANYLVGRGLVKLT